MKTIKSMTVVVVMLLTVAGFTGCDLYTYSTSAVQTNYENPRWAPPYYNGARYYYLPDIEAYYDLSGREFIYLNNGQWNYSPEFPTIYGSFNLNDCFSIVLDINVFRPWMHHQYYVSHYPRYYYRDYYDHSNIPYVRAFNENSRSAIYWGENERGRARSWDNNGMNSNRQFKYPKQERERQNLKNNNQDDRRSEDNGSNRQSSQSNVGYNKDRTVSNSGESMSRNNNSVSRQPQNDNNVSRQAVTNDNTVRQQRNDNSSPRQPASDNSSRQQPGRSSDVQRTTQATNYYGRTIGQPVKVEKQMRKQADNKENGNGRDSQERR